MKRKNNRSGMVLMVTLWVLSILSLLALSLGRKTNLELSLAKYLVGKQQARQYAGAGIAYARKKIARDSADKDTAQFDTIYDCGLSITKEQDKEELFKDLSLGHGSFTILRAKGSEQDADAYGFSDEESKININGLNARNKNILEELITNKGFDKSIAEEIVAAVLDWKDADQDPFNEEFGAENSYYESLTPSYKCKNDAFQSLGELLLVRGMTKEIYQKIKESLTVFSLGNTLKVNVNTASPEVLRAIARSVVAGNTSFNENDIEPLVEKLIAYRSGEDQIEDTLDDIPINNNEIPFNAAERGIYLNMLAYLTNKSNYIHVTSVGSTKDKKVTATLKAVVNRRDLSIVSFRTN